MPEKRGYTKIDSKPDQFTEMVEKHFHIKNRTGSEYMVVCPFGDHSGTSATLQINVDSGMFVCFSPNCGERGGPRKLMEYCGEKFIKPEATVADVQERLRALDRAVGRRDAQLPPVDEKLLTRYSLTTDYWRQRGYRDEIIDLFDMGYDLLNDAPTIAARNSAGELLGVIRRNNDPDAWIRYANPKGFKRNLELFGAHLAFESPRAEVTLVEGPTDTASVWQTGFIGLGQYGSSISPEQVALLRRLGVTTVTLMFDNDDAGRKATQKAQGIYWHKRGGKNFREYKPETDLRRWFLVRIVDWRPYTGIKDPGAAPSEVIIDAHRKAKLAVL